MRRFLLRKTPPSKLQASVTWRHDPQFRDPGGYMQHQPLGLASMKMHVCFHPCVDRMWGHFKGIQLCWIAGSQGVLDSQSESRPGAKGVLDCQS
jgi:hypothetical protein